jgi:hypothetical protein
MDGIVSGPEVHPTNKGNIEVVAAVGSLRKDEVSEWQQLFGRLIGLQSIAQGTQLIAAIYELLSKARRSGGLEVGLVVEDQRLQQVGVYCDKAREKSAAKVARCSFCF